MTFSGNSQTGLQKLIDLVVANKGKPVDFVSHFPSMMQRRIPDDIVFDRSQGDFLMITDEEHQQYHKCLEYLGNEADLECMSRKEIDTELWHLVCDAYANSDKLKGSGAVKEKAALFESNFLELSKPIKEYEVLIPIQGLQLNSNTLYMGDVKLVQMSDGIVREWDLKKGSTPWMDQLLDAIGKSGVAIIPEKGNDPQKAIDRARGKLVTVLNVLRMALLIDHEPRIVSFRIHDEQMLFELGEYAVLREVENSKLLEANWSRSFRGMDLKLEGVIESQVTKSAELLNDLAKAIGETGKGVRVRFIRAMEWIGSSVTRESTDDKIVDLCTALEAFLATKDSPRKGEIIALRTQLLPQLLGKPFFDPVKVLTLYEKRSYIVHGSDKGVCTDSEYIALRTITVQVLQHALTYVRLNNIGKHADFLRALHKDSKLVDAAVQWWKPYPDYYEEICAAVESYNKAIGPQLPK